MTPEELLQSCTSKQLYQLPLFLSIWEFLSLYNNDNVTQWIWLIKNEIYLLPRLGIDSKMHFYLQQTCIQSNHFLLSLFQLLPLILHSALLPPSLRFAGYLCSNAVFSQWFALHTMMPSTFPWIINQLSKKKLWNGSQFEDCKNDCIELLVVKHIETILSGTICGNWEEM